MNFRLTATNAIRIEFHGRTAHAGEEPWKGRSALDAMELAAHALNLMREHVEPTAHTSCSASCRSSTRAVTRE
jgi:aminobenzoyl-glutamate utilization protein B